MKLKRIAALLGAFTIASSLFIAGCGNTTTSNNDKVWRVGTDATYAPLDLKTKIRASWMVLISILLML